MNADAKKFMAETFGTFAVVFAGTGAIVVNDVSGGSLGRAGIALTFGLIVLAMIYAVGEVSGAHLNPAVTLGLWLAKRLEPRLLLPYFFSQFAGAVFASAAVAFLFPSNCNLGSTHPSGSVWQSFVLECVMTWLLMFVVLSVSSAAGGRGMLTAVAVGAVIGLEALFGGPISGASMNPARSLGPALVSGRLDDLWIYLSAPFVGAILGVVTCGSVQDEGCC